MGWCLLIHLTLFYSLLFYFQDGIEDMCSTTAISRLVPSMATAD